MTANTPINTTVLATIKRLLADDLTTARSRADLKRKLWYKGYTLRDGHLATLPEGRVICPVAELQPPQASMAAIASSAVSTN
ncbi:MAG: hypothetical protein AAF092_06225 [Pseudomonadota bacterium]